MRYGLVQDMAVGGALFELESILAVSDAARIGWWTMEWWWNQPDVPQIKAFDDSDPAPHRQSGERAELVRLCRGPYAGEHRQSGEIAGSVVLARALQGYVLPPDVALGPDRAFFRDA